MSINQVFTAILGGSPASTTPYDLSGLATGTPRRFFRRVFYLRLDWRTTAILSEGAIFSATFAPWSYNAKGAASSLAATLSGGTTVMVELPAPRSVTRITGSASVYGSFELYRVDGAVLAHEPTLTKSSGSTITDGDFISQNFALQASGMTSTSHVTEVQVTSHPTGPRIGLALPAAPETAVFFWQQPGEFTSNVTVSAGAELAAALQNYLDSLEDRPTSGQIAVALVIESDAECQFTLNQIFVSTAAVVDTFTTGEPKAVLRFGKSGLTSQTAEFQLPAGSAVNSAQVQVVESLRPDRLAEATGEPTPLPSSHTGAFISPEKFASQYILPVEAMTITGVTLGLASLKRKTELTLELQEDWQGQPSGKILAEALLKLDKISSPAWLTLLFQQPVIMSTAPHWLVLRAASGSAIWLAESDSAASITVMERLNGSNGTPSSTLEGLRATYQFLTRTQPSQEAPLSGETSLTVNLGSQPLTPLPADESDPDTKTRVYDFTSTLQNYLNSAAGDPVSVPLSFSAFMQGMVTVKSLHVAYEV